MGIKRINIQRDYKKHEQRSLEAIKDVCEYAAFSGGKYADQYDQEFAEYCEVKYAS